MYLYRKLRYFILELGILTYYKSSSASDIEKPLGFFNLKDFIDCTLQDTHQLLLLVKGNGSEAKRGKNFDLELKYDNLAERDEWLQSIKTHATYASSEPRDLEPLSTINSKSSPPSSPMPAIDPPSVTVDTLTSIAVTTNVSKAVNTASHGKALDVASIVKSAGAHTLVSSKSHHATELSGKFYKLGHVFKTWKLRYFILQKGILTYYSSDDSSDVIGTVYLKDLKTCEIKDTDRIFIQTETLLYNAAAAGGAAAVGDQVQQRGHNNNLTIRIDDENERTIWFDAIHSHAMSVKSTIEPSAVGAVGTSLSSIIPPSPVAEIIKNDIKSCLIDAGKKKKATRKQSAYINFADAYGAGDDVFTSNTVITTTTAAAAVHNEVFTNTVSKVNFAAAVQQVMKEEAALPEPFEGYMMKRGHQWKSWKKRYFIMQQGYLAYYNNKDSPTYIDRIDLNGYFVGEKYEGAKNRLHLYDHAYDCKEKSKEGKDLILEIGVNELDEWIEHLHIHISYAVKRK